jgi:hypothetical protein
MQSIRSEGFAMPRLVPLAACMAAVLALPLAADANADPHLLPHMASARLRALIGNTAPVSQTTLDSALARFHSSLHAAAPPKMHSQRVYTRPVGHATLEVTDCNDGPPGSDSNDLRDTIAAAPTGSTIDLTALTHCTNSIITLTNGAIPITVDDLNIQGPGASVLAIDGGYDRSRSYNRVFVHAGTGILGIYDLTVTDAIYKGPTRAYGGCIKSEGSVLLMDSAVTDCGVLGTGSSSSPNYVFGGGIFAFGGVVAKYSTISGNGALSYSAGGYGGGIFAETHVGGNGVFASTSVVTKYSTISNNSIVGLAGQLGAGGGIFTNGYGDVRISGTTISGNYALGSYGGLVVGYSTTFSTSIQNSTISSNRAGSIAGASIRMPLALYNSTIASNVNSGYSGFTAGLNVEGTTIFQSSLISLNVDGTIDNDLGSLFTPQITGSNNLITQASIDVPSGTLNDCPKLAPLADNGGFVYSQALLSGSKAIDMGNNTSGLTYDTRGSPFNRVIGSNADIGSYERQPRVVDDIIFQSRFESRCR